MAIMQASDIRIRDPFILREGENSYLFGTTSCDAFQEKGNGFLCWKTRDLVHFEGPIRAFTPPENFWADRSFWAPEVHKINGVYYMFATFYSEKACRGTQILRSEQPEGPYVPLTAGPFTPADWECLDGTFYEENGRFYTVFCHEWLQIKDGSMELAELSRDLTHLVSEPLTLFHATDAAWTRPINNSTDCFVTDGPFLFPMECGKLAMIWSSYAENGYALGVAYSENGIRGPWIQEEQPVYGKDGGHGMIFRDPEGRLLLCLHAPNENPFERPAFLELQEVNGKILVK